MQNKLDDINTRSLKQLIQPIELMEEFPVNEIAAHTVLRARSEAKDIIKSRDSRLLVVVGPCSIHSYNSAIEYGKLLLPAIKKYRKNLCIIMRTYFEKPRTSVGWKGLINDPHLIQSKSITDACISWEETEKLLHVLSEAQNGK